MNEKQKEIIDKLRWFEYRNDLKQVYGDILEYEALKIALTCDIARFNYRKQKQEEISKKYTAEEWLKIVEICRDIERLLLQMLNGYRNYLGEIYTEIGCCSNIKQQFFTPMEVARLMIEFNFSSIDTEKHLVTVNEPCCGSGVLLLAFLEKCASVNLNYTSKVLIVANDIDKNCVNMCYLQLAFAGATAIVIQQDTLSQAVLGEKYITPAFALQYNKFATAYKFLNVASKTNLAGNEIINDNKYKENNGTGS